MSNICHFNMNYYIEIHVLIMKYQQKYYSLKHFYYFKNVKKGDLSIDF